MNARTRWMIPVLAAALTLSLGAATASAQSTISAGSAIPVILGETVSSKNANVGQKVSGTVASDVSVGGKVVIPRGSTVSMSVASVHDAGRFKGQPKLYLKLDSVVVKGSTYSTVTRWAGGEGGSRGKRTAVGAGGGAAAGAIIGAIAGGGKGAAIGAGVGAAAGTGAAAATGSAEYKMNAETRLSFTLKENLTIR